MAKRPPARSGKRVKSKRPTPASVRAAAERAVERVLGSPESFKLMVQRLEQAGWQIERAPEAAPAPFSTLTPPARAR